LLERYGVLTREAVHAEGIAGGFSAIYEVLKAMEERGRVRRGYFVAGLGATQFAVPGADERLRTLRGETAEPRPVVLAATDPANPYGAALPWPAETREGPTCLSHRSAPGLRPQPVWQAETGAARDRSRPAAATARPQRVAGAQVVLHSGALLAWIPRSERNLLTFLPEAEPERSQAAATLAQGLASLVERGHRRAVLVAQVDGQPVDQSSLARFLVEAGFTPGSRGYLKRRAIAGVY
jgi:ATP-dependent Lhr-like helicase